MTKGTIAFRIIISVLLTLNILWSALIGCAFIEFYVDIWDEREYGVWVAGVSVTENNKDDVLGDGTVIYNEDYHILTFNNAVIEYDYAIIHSIIDLTVELIGENKFLCKDNVEISAIYVAEGRIFKDLFFTGDGSLTVEFQNVSTSAQGIVAADLTVAANVNVIMPDCSNIVNAVICDSSFMLANNANLTVKNGSGFHSSALRVRGNTLLEGGTVLDISVNPGSTESCKGLSINGDLILGEGAAMYVSVDDAVAKLGEGLRVTGLIDVGAGSTVTVSAKKAPAIECYGVISLDEGSAVSASTLGESADIFCCGAMVNYGAQVNAAVEALGGIHNKA